MKNLKADRVVSLSAIVVSIATLFLIFYQTNLFRQEQKASVLPSLTIGYSVDGNRKNIKEAIWVSNQGLGPAFIDKISIVHNKEIHNTDPYGFISATQDKEEITFINRIFPGKIVPANEGITLIEKNTDSTSKVILSNIFEYAYEINQMPTDNKDKAIIEIIYKSVYGDRWKISSNQTTPVEID